MGKSWSAEKSRVGRRGSIIFGSLRRSLVLSYYVLKVTPFIQNLKENFGGSHKPNSNLGIFDSHFRKSHT